MKLFFLIIFFCFSPILVAQNEFLNSTNSFAPISSGTFSTSKTPTTSAFKLNTKPSTTTSSSSLIVDKPIEFTQKNDFKNPGDLYKAKLNKSDATDNSKSFRQNQFLGDFKTSATFVKISYRDFGAIDGDMVSVWVNDKVVIGRIFLEGDFKGIELGLEKGFNKIDFQALNEGYSAPNTAEFRVYDDQGVLVSANQWNLATGFKATIILTKE
jgi:hypothetical protein